VFGTPSRPKSSKALSGLITVVPLGAGGVVLSVVVVAVRVVVHAWLVPRLHRRRDAVDAVVVELLVPGAEDGLELVADAVAVVVDGEADLERVHGVAGLPDVSNTGSRPRSAGRRRTP